MCEKNSNKYFFSIVLVDNKSTESRVLNGNIIVPVDSNIDLNFLFFKFKDILENKIGDEKC